MSNITQVVNTDKSMKSLKKGMHYSDLDQLLSSSGPFTFFAPSDLAFEKQGNGFLDNLMTSANKAALADLMHSHIVDGKISLQDLKDGDKLKTVNGRELSVAVKGSNVSIDGAAIAAMGQKVSNGVIHYTDTVFVKKP
jgi:uncharacterized surface protein with fasciclin (FAS1) repeats